MLLNVALFVLLVAAVDSNQQALLARRALVSANNAFSIDLYNALRREPANLVISPLSASTILALMYLGAGGRTAQQLKSALHLPDDAAQVAEGFSDVLSTLLESEPMTVLMANKLYAKEGTNIKENFRQIAESNFAADVQEVNFSNRLEAVRSINQWADEVTEGKVKSVFTQDKISSVTRSLLISANYFEGSWNEQFDESQTIILPFWTSLNTQINASMMTKTSTFGCKRYPELNATIVRIPFEDTSFSMLVILPSSIEGLTALEEQLRRLDFSRVGNEMKEETVNVTLPKFSFSRRLILQPVLSQLGVTDLLQHNANLTEITDKKIFVNKIVQKSFIDINERGVGDAQEKDNSTTTSITTGVIPSPIREFNVNHPFIYVILGSNETVLFIGKIIDPTI